MKRISLPTYPFDRQSYWPPPSPSKDLERATQSLHPMIDRNVSDLDGLRFCTTWNGSEFFLRDHVVEGRPILPGVCYVEMARAAGVLCSNRKISAVKDMVWLQPLSLGTGKGEVSIRLTPQDQGMDFRVETQNHVGNNQSHAEGRLLFDHPLKTEPSQTVDFETIKAACPHSMAPTTCYETFKSLGFEYGPSFRVIQQLHYGDGQALATLELPVRLLDGFESFLLHPSLLDGALQVGYWLVPEQVRNNARFTPFGIGTVQIHAPPTPVCHVHVTSASVLPQLMKIDVRLYDEAGHPLVTLLDYSAKMETVNRSRSGRPDHSSSKPSNPEPLDSMDEALIALFRQVEAEDLSIEDALEAYENLSPSLSET